MVLATLWPLKAHYVFWFGSLSGILPYIQVFARIQTDVDAQTIGILFFILPFVVSFAKPLACSAADHTQRHSYALLMSQALTLVSYGLLVIAPVLVNVGLAKTLIWWLICLLALVANTSMGIAVSLTDTIVMRDVAIFNGREENGAGAGTSYGSVRIWGTVGFGVFGILSGYINEYLKEEYYLVPGLLLFIAIESLDLFCMYMFYHRRQSKTINVEKETLQSSGKWTPSSQQHHISIAQPLLKRTRTKLITAQSVIAHKFTQVVSIYRHYPELLQHTFTIFAFGVITAFHWSFFFWFLEEIRGKNTGLMGLCIAVESFAGEIPVFLVANKIIEHVGCTASLCISLAAFSLRYACYGWWLVQDLSGDGSYWDILLIEATQGLTFSLFYTCMTHIAMDYAGKCDQIGQMAAVSQGESGLADTRLSMTNDHRSASVPSIDEHEEAVNESRHSTLQTPQNSNSGGFNSESPSRHLLDSPPSATMQGLMSACYEGLGLGVGSLLGGFLVKRLGTFGMWRIASMICASLVLFNLLVEALRWWWNTRNSRTSVPG